MAGTAIISSHRLAILPPPAAVKPAEISADDFFSVEINVADKNVVISGTSLMTDGKKITTTHTVNGAVH